MASVLAVEVQLEYIITGRMQEALDRYVDGDWQRRYEIFDLPKSLFRESAAGIELPSHGIATSPATYDGRYGLEDNGKYRSYYQERGRVRAERERQFLTLEEAKIDALENTYLYGLILRDP